MKTALARMGLVAAAAIVLVLTTAFAPVALRGIGAFGVESVEVIGAYHLSPEDAARAAGIERGANVFADQTPWLESLRAHPLVADARIERRLPGTIVLHIEETVPVALARTPELRAIGANGRVLPADPLREDMDLPVVTVQTRVSAQGRVVDTATLDIIGFLVTTQRIEPGLIGWISEIGTHGDAIRLILRNESNAEVLVPGHPAASRLRDLHVTIGELAAPSVATGSGARTRRAGDADLNRVQRIDVRFADQITVTLQKGKI